MSDLLHCSASVPATFGNECTVHRCIGSAACNRPQLWHNSKPCPAIHPLLSPHNATSGWIWKQGSNPGRQFSQIAESSVTSSRVHTFCFRVGSPWSVELRPCSCGLIPFPTPSLLRSPQASQGSTLTPATSPRNTPKERESQTRSRRS